MKLKEALQPAPPQPRGGIGILLASFDDNNLGLRIDRVIPGSPAAKAGLDNGWIITMVDDAPLA